MCKIDVVGDRSGVEGLDQIERRFGVEHLRLADIFEREPHLTAVRCGGDVGTERARLLHLADDRMVGDRDNVDLGIEG